MIYLSSFLSALVWMALGSMLLRKVAFRRRTLLKGIGLAAAATPVFAIALAFYGMHPTGVPRDPIGSAKVYIPAAVAAGLLQALLARKRRV